MISVLGLLIVRQHSGRTVEVDLVGMKDRGQTLASNDVCAGDNLIGHCVVGFCCWDGDVREGAMTFGAGTESGVLGEGHVTTTKSKHPHAS